MKVSAPDLIGVSRDILGRGKSFRFEARGRSMAPFIRDGDILEVTPVGARIIRCSDVIFYHVDQARAVAHRVIRVGSDDQKSVFITRGDAQEGAGEKVVPDQVLGIVSAIERNGKRRVLGRPWHKPVYVLYRPVFSCVVIARRWTARIVSGVQGIRVYRFLARRFLIRDVSYRWQPDEDSVVSLVAKEKGRGIGTLSLHKGAPGEVWGISSMWVYWRFRGLGIGERLTEVACHRAALQGAAEIQLHVFNDNRRALGLYRKLGFTVVSEVATIDAQRVVAGSHRQRFLMRKSLDPFPEKRPVSCEQLLISLARSTLRFESLVEPPACGWPEFFEAACRQRVAPLVSKVLEGIEGRTCVPEETRALFRNSYLVTAGRYAALSARFQKVFQTLSREDIEFIVFKGPVLAETVYRDPGVRSMTDVDILIHHRDLTRAHHCLKGLGYEAGISDKTVSRLRPNPYHNSLLYHNPEKALVHLYWHPINLCLGSRASFEGFPVDSLWERAEDAEIAGYRIRTFGPADTFVYLCLHAFLHGFTPLILLFDLDAVARGKDVSFWHDVVARAQEFGWQRHVYHALTILKGRDFSVEGIPSFVWDRLKPERISYFERAFIATALGCRSTGVFGRLRWALFGMQPGFLARVRFLLQNIFVPRIDMAVVRQKDPSCISIREYLRRLVTS